MKEYIPQFVRISSKDDLDTFLRHTHVLQVHDLYRSLQDELFLVSHPADYFADEAAKKSAVEKNSSKLLKKSNEYCLGSWIFHPWSKTLWHILTYEDQYLLRTYRNRNLLTVGEQKKLHKKRIAIAGLSVGYSILTSFVRYGIGTAFAIADFDDIASVNTNRAPFALASYGMNKCMYAAESICEIDPYLTIDAYSEGLLDGNMKTFVSHADLIVDAFDSFGLKIKLRKLAKQLLKPVVSGFDIDNGVLLIVERYDRENDVSLQLLLNGKSESDLELSRLTPKERTDLFVGIIGRKYHSKKMLSSVYDVGKILTGYPQTIIATQLAASCFTYLSKKILLNETCPSRRYFFSLDTLLS